MNNNEVWVKTEVNEFYEISNLGNVRSINRTIKKSDGKIIAYRSKVLKVFFFANTGYPYVCLYKNSKKKNCTIHRLLAKAFIPNPKNKHQINHINGNRKDYRLENLEWVTQCENMQHSYDTGLSFTPKGDNHYLYGRKGEDCVNSKIIINLETGIFYYSANEAALTIGMKVKKLRERLCGRTKNKTSFVYA